MTVGNHSVVVTATFKGDEEFTSDFVYDYQVKSSAIIAKISAEGSTEVDIYTLDGVLIMSRLSDRDLHTLPSGIYILKSPSGSATKLVR